MSLDKELREIDPVKITQLFVDIWGAKKLDQKSVGAFLFGERERAFERYPGLNALRMCIVESGPELEAQGHSREEIANRLLGMTIVATVLLAYADSEL